MLYVRYQRYGHQFFKQNLTEGITKTVRSTKMMMVVMTTMMR